MILDTHIYLPNQGGDIPTPLFVYSYLSLYFTLWVPGTKISYYWAHYWGLVQQQQTNILEVGLPGDEIANGPCGGQLHYIRAYIIYGIVYSIAYSVVPC